MAPENAIGRLPHPVRRDAQIRNPQSEIRNQGNGSATPLAPAHAAPSPAATIPFAAVALRNVPGCAKGVRTVRPTRTVVALSNWPAPVPWYNPGGDVASLTWIAVTFSAAMFTARPNVSVTRTPFSYTAATSVSGPGG